MYQHSIETGEHFHGKLAIESFLNRVVITAFVLAQNGRLLNVFLHLKVMESCCTTGFSRLMGEVLWECCTLLFFNCVYTNSTMYYRVFNFLGRQVDSRKSWRNCLILVRFQRI